MLEQLACIAWHAAWLRFRKAPNVYADTHALASLKIPDKIDHTETETEAQDKPNDRIDG